MMDYVAAVVNGYPLLWVMFGFVTLLPLVVIFARCFWLKVRLLLWMTYPALGTRLDILLDHGIQCFSQCNFSSMLHNIKFCQMFNLRRAYENYDYTIVIAAVHWSNYSNYCRHFLVLLSFHWPPLLERSTWRFWTHHCAVMLLHNHCWTIPWVLSWSAFVFPLAAIVHLKWTLVGSVYLNIMLFAELYILPFYLLSLPAVL